MKPKGPNQKAKYKALNARLNKYLLLVQHIYDTYNLEAAKIASGVDYDPTKPFTFSSYPTTKKKVQDLLESWSRDMFAVINTGTAKEWSNSNEVQDLLADKVLSYYYGKSHGRRKRKYYQTNSDALKAFQQRVDNGMTLSEKIWNQSANYKEELEYALSSGIQKGMSAVTLSKRVSKYLNDFDTLKHDYKEKYGKEVDCLNCEYRSMRLARSEINMAYRKAEQERWKQFDFVIGYEIKLSKSHHDRMPGGDICDDLKGKYPKDFEWTGWHPNDMCYAVPILKTEEEFFNDEPSDNEVTDVPEAMKEWIVKNQMRMEKASHKGTQPYWYKDNFKGNSYLNVEFNSIQGKSDVTVTKSKEVLSLSSSQKSNLSNVEKAIGVLRGEPKTIEEALIGANQHTNDNFEEHRYNCQCCVAAYILRKMGFDVKAVGINIKETKSIPYIFAARENQAKLYIDNITKEYAEVKQVCYELAKDNPLKDAFKQLNEATKEKGTYQLAYARTSKHGHRLVVERLSDNTMQIVCPQSLRVYDDWLDFFIKDNVWYIKGIDIVRIDDKLINTEMIKWLVTR